jgi:CubicO group peptidase (beta-lactamase class C family)
MTSYPIHGHLPAQFDALRSVIANNFAEHDELGFQFCVMQHGETLIDIHAGWTDRHRTKEVDEDTLFAVFSSGKAAAALVIAWLVEEDRIGYDQLVETIWPEFSQAGKSGLTIGQVMSHQAGLSGITNPEWTAKDWFDWDKTITQLEQQAPIFEPGSASGYHPVTYGFLAGEIAQRADKQQRSLGRILREELCQPGDADVWIGLPPSEHERCADMQKPKALPDMGEITEATRWAFLKPWSSPGGMGAAAWREAELAGSNCHATANGLATLMQAGVDGRISHTPILSEDIQAAFAKSRIKGQNLVLPFELDFAAGVMRNDPNFFYGPNAATLGHSGWGGSCVFADPLSGLHGAYVMNRQRNSLLGDVRPRALIDWVYSAL